MIKKNFSLFTENFSTWFYSRHYSTKALDFFFWSVCLNFSENPCISVPSVFSLRPPRENSIMRYFQIAYLFSVYF